MDSKLEIISLSLATELGILSSYDFQHLLDVGVRYVVVGFGPNYEVIRQ